MNIQPIIPVKADERGERYDIGVIKFVVRKAGTVSADHQHSEPEIMYLIKGQIKLTVGENTQVIDFPAKISVAANEYHKLEALTDFVLLYER